MTATNPNPFANPLNQGRFINYPYGQSCSRAPQYLKTASASSLTVPDPKPYSSSQAQQSQAQQLTVPNQDIPYFNGPVPTSGFLGKSPLFKLLDGSIIDLKNCKIVFDAASKWKASGYWNDPCSNVQCINYGSPSNDWEKTESIESLLNRVEQQPKGSYDPNLSPESIRYWKMAEEESKKLMQNLTDEQKSLLDDLQNGRLVPLTRLEDEEPK